MERTPKKLETDDRTTNEYEKVIKDCVNSQLLSDVPVGTFLSSSIDSPLVNYFANEKKN